MNEILTEAVYAGSDCLGLFIITRVPIAERTRGLKLMKMQAIVDLSAKALLLTMIAWRNYVGSGHWITKVLLHGWVPLLILNLVIVIFALAFIAIENVRGEFSPKT